MTSLGSANRVLGNLQIEHRRLLGLVRRIDEALGFAAIVGLEAGAVAGS
tara:strand:- start:416 stop:562 length:147 start_codon:yes stop_codon:yes gene_type:complete